MTVCGNNLFVTIVTILAGVDLITIIRACCLNGCFFVVMAEFGDSYLAGSAENIAKLLFAAIIVRKVELACSVSGSIKRSFDILVAIIAIARVASIDDTSRFNVSVIISD